MNAGEWVTWVAAVIALIALYYTFRQAQSARRQTELQEQMARDAQQPYVWADIRADTVQGELLRFVVRNEGPTVAHDVRVVFDPPLQAGGALGNLQPVNDLLARGLRAMPPGREMQWNLGLGWDILDETKYPDTPRAFTLTISADGPTGPVPDLTYELDLSELRETPILRTGSLHEVAKAIEAHGRASQPRPTIRPMPPQ